MSNTENLPRSNYVYHVTPRTNITSILESGLIPHCGPRSQEIGEQIERVYVFRNKEELENGLLNWLGEAFEDTLDPDEDLVIIEIDPKDTFSSEAGFNEDFFEWATTKTIPVGDIVAIYDEAWAFEYENPDRLFNSAWMLPHRCLDTYQSILNTVSEMTALCEKAEEAVARQALSIDSLENNMACITEFKSTFKEGDVFPPILNMMQLDVENGQTRLMQLNERREKSIASMHAIHKKITEREHIINELQNHLFPDVFPLHFFNADMNKEIHYHRDTLDSLNSNLDKVEAELEHLKEIEDGRYLGRLSDRQFDFVTNKIAATFKHTRQACEKIIEEAQSLKQIDSIATHILSWKSGSESEIKQENKLKVEPI